MLDIEHYLFGLLMVGGLGAMVGITHHNLDVVSQDNQAVVVQIEQLRDQHLAHGAHEQALQTAVLDCALNRVDYPMAVARRKVSGWVLDQPLSPQAIHESVAHVMPDCINTVMQQVALAQPVPLDEARQRAQELTAL